MIISLYFFCCCCFFWCFRSFVSVCIGLLSRVFSRRRTSKQASTHIFPAISLYCAHRLLVHSQLCAASFTQSLYACDSIRFSLVQCFERAGGYYGFTCSSSSTSSVSWLMWMIFIKGVKGKRKRKATAKGVPDLCLLRSISCKRLWVRPHRMCEGQVFGIFPMKYK